MPGAIVFGTSIVKSDEIAGAERDVETRRRRAVYRAHHRGTKEMDWLVGRYADAYIDRLDGDALTHFEQFLELPDPELQKWIVDASIVPVPEFADLVAAVRAFHGLPARA